MEKSNKRNTKITSPSEELEKAYNKIEDLKFEILKLRKMIYGSRSEKLEPQEEHPNQLTLFEKPVIHKEESVESAPKKKQRRPGRNPAPEHLKEKIIIEKAPFKETIDKKGNPLSLLGYETSQRIDFVPAHFLKVIIKREKWGHRDSRDLLYTAPPLKAIVQKGKFMDSFLHHVVFQKFFMSLPLYRQIQDYNSSITISKSMLSDLVKRFSGFYKAIVEAIRFELFQQNYMQGDETTVRCQGLKKGNMKRGNFFVFRNRVGAYFHYGETKGQIEIKKVFDFSGQTPPTSFFYNEETKALEWRGYFMCDGAPAYGAEFDGTKTIEMGCMSHARRKFNDIKEIEMDAHWFLNQFRKLYKVEKDIKKKALQFNWTEEEFYTQRGIERKKNSTPIFELIEKQVNDFLDSGSVLPSSKLGGALSYFKNQASKLRIFLKDGELPIDNNESEQSLKSSVIGRKNYLFVGSEDAGRWAAICYSLMESCRILGIDPRAYLEMATNGSHEGLPPHSLTPYALKDKLPKLLKNH